MKKNISVITAVYNEEKRIANFIRSFASWSDDVIIIDKSSTDDTAQIISNMMVDMHNVHLISVPYTDLASITCKGVEIAKNDWVLLVTASDIMDKSLGKAVVAKINNPDFDYEHISLPYKMYVFGICNVHSPWNSTYKGQLGLKSKLSISNRVHEEFIFSGKHYVWKDITVGYLYHLTHRNLEVFFERHLRYTQMEPRKYEGMTRNMALKKCTKEIVWIIKDCLLKRRTIMLGWDGIALFLAIVSYYMMKYLFVWNSFRDKTGEEIYESLYEKIID